MTQLRSTALALVAVLLGITACCGRSHSAYFFSQRTPGRAFNNVVWNGQTNVASGERYFVRVLLADHVVPSTEMLELYDVEGTRLVLPGVRSSEDPGDGCPQYFVEYELELADGLYSIVHRFSSAPAGLTTLDADMATTFEGEAALVATVRFGEPALDGDRADAGP